MWEMVHILSTEGSLYVLNDIIYIYIALCCLEGTVAQYPRVIVA